MSSVHPAESPSFLESFCADLAPLVPLAHKVARVHGVRQPHLLEVRDAVQELHATLEAAPDWEAVLREHLGVYEQLEQLRASADAFRIPEHACTSYARLYRGLETLEAQLLRRLYLEQGTGSHRAV
jgi:iron-sulfur cluster repair protein YtfE (RIC family)